MCSYIRKYELAWLSIKLITVLHTPLVASVLKCNGKRCFFESEAHFVPLIVDWRQNNMSVLQIYSITGNIRQFEIIILVYWYVNYMTALANATMK